MKEKYEEKLPIKEPVDSEVQKQDMLSKEEKEKLQVHDGQNNHDVEERGGF